MRRIAAVCAAALLAACTPAAPKQNWHVLTGLPLFLGEGSVTDVLEGKSGPAPIITALDKGRKLLPLDTAEPAALAKVTHLFAIQPGALPPEELVALDDWVRKGGRAVIFADPDMVWSHGYGLGDPRTPPPSSLLDPLFAHWGLMLEGQRRDPKSEQVKQGGMTISVVNPGQWKLTGKDCNLEPPLIAKCALGKGQVLLVADADLADGGLWAELGGDNAAFIESLLQRMEERSGK